MIIPYGQSLDAQMIEPGEPIRRTNEELTMKWETPVAIDMRFGMEITMYISNR